MAIRLAAARRAGAGAAIRRGSGSAASTGVAAHGRGVAVAAGGSSYDRCASVLSLWNVALAGIRALRRPADDRVAVVLLLGSRFRLALILGWQARGVVLALVVGVVLGSRSAQVLAVDDRAACARDQQERQARNEIRLSRCLHKPPSDCRAPLNAMKPSFYYVAGMTGTPNSLTFAFQVHTLLTT